MNWPLFILVAWFTPGILSVIGLLWFKKTHEKQLLDEIPSAQIFGCIPPPALWAALVILLFCGPVVLPWAVCEAIKEGRNDVPGGRPVATKQSGAVPRWPWVVLFALFGAGLTAYGWANACPAKPHAAFWEDLARGAGGLLIIGVLPAALARSGLLRGLRFSFMLVPLCVLPLVPSVASMTVGWEGGWIPAIAGAVVGAAAGAVNGWLFNRWIMPEYDKRRGRENSLPSDSTAGPGLSGPMAEHS